MSIFFNFKCWGCDEIPCSCKKVELKDPDNHETESTTTPVLYLGDIAVQNNISWAILEIQDGIAIGKRVSGVGEVEYKKITGRYRKMVHATRPVVRRRK